MIAGDHTNELFVITRGTAMVSVPTQHGVTRLAAFTPGMSFGELAFLDRTPRSANVTAVEEVECRVLTRAVFERLSVQSPVVTIKLLENLARGLTSLLRQADRELAALR